MKHLLLFVIALLTGCANLDGAIKALDGQAGGACGTGATWNGSPMTVHVYTFGGKSTGTAGGTGEAKCGESTVKFVNDGKATTAPTASKVAP